MNIAVVAISWAVVSSAFALLVARSIRNVQEREEGDHAVHAVETRDRLHVAGVDLGRRQALLPARAVAVVSAADRQRLSVPGFELVPMVPCDRCDVVFARDMLREVETCLGGLLCRECAHEEEAEVEEMERDRGDCCGGGGCRVCCGGPRWT